MPEYFLDREGNYKFNSDKKRRELIPGGKISKERNIVLELLVASPGIHSHEEIDRLLFTKIGSGISKNALEALISRLRRDLPEEIRGQLATSWGEGGYEWKIGE